MTRLASPREDPDGRGSQAPYSVRRLDDRIHTARCHHLSGRRTYYNRDGKDARSSHIEQSDRRADGAGGKQATSGTCQEWA